MMDVTFREINFSEKPFRFLSKNHNITILVSDGFSAA